MTAFLVLENGVKFDALVVTKWPSKLKIHQNTFLAAGELTTLLQAT